MNLHDLSFRTCELEAKMTNVHPRGSVLEIHSEIDMKWKHMISVRTCKSYNQTSIIPIKRHQPFRGQFQSATGQNCRLKL